MRCPKHFWPKKLLLALCCLWGFCATAQTLRDPTLAPRPAAALASSGAGSVAESRTLNLAVLRSEGKSWVMHESRLYAVGDRIGAAQIERITESEVWLREGKNLRKISLYPGVQRLAPVPVKE